MAALRRSVSQESTGPGMPSGGTVVNDLPLMHRRLDNCPRGVLVRLEPRLRGDDHIDLEREASHGPQGIPAGRSPLRLFVDDDQQVDVAVRLVVASCYRSEEDDRAWVTARRVLQRQRGSRRSRGCQYVTTPIWHMPNMLGLCDV